jgi:sugar lactone lactonase YvrE
LSDFDSARGRVHRSGCDARRGAAGDFTYDAVWLFEAATPGSDDWFSGPVWWLPFTGVKGAEGICFDGPDTLLIAAEEGAGKLYQVPVAKLIPSALAIPC